MSTITVAEIRQMVDDLDNVFRAGIENGEIQTVFSKNRPSLVSIIIKLVNENTETIYRIK